MPEKFIIQGGKPLHGVIEIRGYKNAAGAILAACLLTDEECIIDNLPLVDDVFSIIEILKSMGVMVEWQGQRRLRIKAGSGTDPQAMDFQKTSKTRLSVLLMGALLARFGDFKISHPGGDRIGLRPIETHIEALKKLGAEITLDNGFYYFKTPGLRGAEIILKEFSVTATENLMMAAVFAQGKTIIKGAAAEPQVQDLGKFLQKMGAKIQGLDSHTIRIEGISHLKGAEHEIIPDPSEAATFIAMSAITPGEVEVKNIRFDHLDLFLEKMKEIGVHFKKGLNCIRVSFSPEIKPAKVQALPYPGFPTDHLPVIIPLLTQAQGKSLMHDPLYENRLNYVQELRKMGADIEIVDPHRAIIFGKTPLKGLTIESWDIRAGASLIIAGLLANGQTSIENIAQVDRGYEKIEERLQKLGAHIKRIKY